MSDIYLNHAATSYPKPASVSRAVYDTISQIPSEPGRSSGRVDIATMSRSEIAALFHVPRPEQVVLSASCTAGLNMAVCGLLKDGGHAVSCVDAHNSVLRPLHHMDLRNDVSLSFILPRSDGLVSPTALRNALRPDTRLVVLTHATNVLGTLQPIEKLAEVAADAKVPFVIDAAQSGGAVNLCYSHLAGRVFVAFTGHKGLLGPQGTGGLIVPDEALPQTLFGGTGIRSESALHPEMLPLRHEAGTPNLPGLAGLTAGVAHLRTLGVEKAGDIRHQHVHALRDGLSRIPQTVLYPLANGDGRAGIVSFNLMSHSPLEVGFTLQEVFGIHVRAGLHCAPKIHRFLNTYPSGTVRVSVGADTTMDEIECFTDAVRHVGKAAV